MYYKIAQLILTPGKKANSTSDIFIAQPDTAKEAMFGKLFVLGEIQENSDEAASVLRFVFDEINRNYYLNEKILLAEKIAALKPEHIFEAALAKTNISLARYAQDEKIKINFNSANFTAGLIHERNMHFSNTGRNKVMFVYRQKIKENAKGRSAHRRTNLINQQYPAKYEFKVADVTKQTADPLEAREENKLFINVVSGRLLENSSFFISNEAFPEYISGRQLVEIATALPPAGAVEQFKHILSSINSYVPFLGILVKSTSLEKPEETRKCVLQSSQESIATLNNTENATENLLSPSGVVNIKKWLAYVKSFMPSRQKDLKTADTSLSLSLKDKIFFKKKSFSLLGLYKNYAIVKDTMFHLFSEAYLLVKSLASGDGFRKILFALPAAALNGCRKCAASAGNLSKKNRILLALSATSLIFMAVNLAVIKNKNSQEEKEIEIKNITSLIEQKQNQAEANLLYNNEEGAKKLFDEIAALMSGYPQDTDERKRQYEEFKRKYDEQLEKIRKFADVGDAAVLVDFKDVSSQAVPENIILSIDTNKIYAADAGQKTIYILDIKSKQTGSVTDLKQPLNKFDSPVWLGKKEIYYLNGTSLVRLDTVKDELHTQGLAMGNAAARYTIISFYNENLYGLDPAEGQIYKHDKSGGSYSAPKKWLKDSTDIKGAVDMAIDGNIYVLKADGSLVKLLRGAKTDFSLGAVEPRLEKPSRLYFSPDKNFIYIMEPSQKRIIVYDKTGNFILQYGSEMFTNLIDLIPDEKNKIIYVLNSTELLSFKATHL